MEVTLPDTKEHLKETSDFLFDVIKRYDHYIGTTNFKVGLMMSFLGTVILGLTVRIMLLNSVQGEISCFRLIAVAASILTILCSLIAAVKLLRVVFPNTKNENSSNSLIFFGDVDSCDNGAAGYFEKVKNADTEELVKDIATQTHNVAGVVNEKFRVLKTAVNMTIYLVIPLLGISLVLLIIEGIM